MSDIKYTYPLILNKVASPQYVTPTLRRARLIDWLNEASTCRAAVIAADAGYGKTTLLFQWEREVPFPCYWYKLDRNDRDWTFHISYLIEAISKRHKGFGRRAHSMLQQLGGPGSSRPGVAAYLLAEMHERLTEPCTFIIDDWHYVNSATEVRGLWNQILRDAPATCRFVFASRAKPQLQFARFKTHAGYAELRTDALRFTESEIHELFRDIYNDPLEPSDVAELERRTEGWAASLQLVEVSLRERHSPEERQRFIRSITATKDSDLFDFLAEEVLDQQPEETRNFLLSTSVLREMTPEAAERLAGVHDGRKQLIELERRGLFTNQLDEVRYRYHNLFREFLQRRLAAERSEAEVIGLHIHAASYFETSQQWPDAIHHYLQAGLQRQAARLIARYGEDVVSEGRMNLVDEWLQQLPNEAIRQNARLSLLFGEACGLRGDWANALTALNRARSYFSRKGDYRQEALACVKLSSMYLSYGDTEASWRAAEEGLALAPKDARSLRLRLEGDLALTRTWLTDGLPAVAGVCRRIAVESRSLGLDHYAAIALHNLGFVEHEMGRLADATVHLERAARFWADLPPNPFADFADLVHVLAANGEIDRAHRLADIAIEKTEAWERPHAEALHGKAVVYAKQGRFREAREYLRRPLESPDALGGGRIVLGSLMADALYLGGASEGDYRALVDVLNQGPIDSRMRLAHGLAMAVANHGLGMCDGECQRIERLIEEWSAKGLVATAVEGRLKLAHFAFEHRNRKAPRLATSAIAAASSSGLLRANRYWIRQFSCHAARLITQREGAMLVKELVDADPEGWRLAAVELLGSASSDDRPHLLAAIASNADRHTTAALMKVGGSDVAEVVKTLVVRLAPRIYIRTLGTLTVHRGSAEGQEVSISRKRLRNMLGLLAAHLHNPLSREQVIETLWPEADPAAGLNNLNQTVFQLRRDLDPTRADGESAPYVVSTPEAVFLHADLVSTDLRAVDRLGSAITGGPVARRREAAEEMLRLVRGEFLLDLRYEDWVQSVQPRIHAELRSALRPLLMADGIDLDHEIGVRAAYTLLQLDEYDEVARIALIRQLALGGRRQAARQAAIDFRNLLREELDEEPPEWLGRLVDWIDRPRGQLPIDVVAGDVPESLDQS